MKPSLDSLIYLIKFLVETENLSLQQAIEKAKVPNEMVSWVMAFFSDPIEVVVPSTLKTEAGGFEFCTDPDDGNPGFYLSGFRRYLQEHRRWSPASVDALDRNSAEIVRRLPRPEKHEAFVTRGLVIGHVQSGKTANMASLIAKSVDRGYKIVIILAGLYNDLRSQTQKRMDQEITGKTDNEMDHPLVERNAHSPMCIRLTQSGLKGDFKPVAVNDMSLDKIKVAVVKKNVRVLNGLIEWFRKSPEALNQFPVLIIDDEADQASINSNYGKKDDDGEDIDPSATNKAIRDLVHLFPKSAYIGFTATPFANLLVDKDVSEDLYPKDFIISLPEPPSYLGPRQLFGLGMSPSILSNQSAFLPDLDIIREITDDDIGEIDNLNSLSEIPPVLERAIVSFILASCARVERGQERQHFSMFIHPSYISSKQETIKVVVQSYLEKVKVFVKLGPQRTPRFYQLAESIWNSDFVHVSKEQNEPILDFMHIWKNADKIVPSIEVKSLNYLSEDFVDFNPNHPRRYIVVGGNRLSRGLTIEGLSTSVFLRDTPYYDTLLQMGRWFGYRPGYADLTRIFVEEAIAQNFADLARVELELREDIRKYAEATPALTPLQLAPIIRDHPAMNITAQGKMGAGRYITSSLSGKVKQTVTFPTHDISKMRENIRTSKEFLGKLGQPSREQDGFYCWEGVSSQKILQYLNQYNFGEAVEMNSAALMTYIARLNKIEELTTWDVFLPNGARDSYEWGANIHTKMVHRSPVTRKTIGVLSSPSDIKKWREMMGRASSDSKQGCLMLYAVDGMKTNPSGTTTFYSGDEKPEIIGLVLVFPDSKISPIAYVSQDFQ